MTSYGQFCAMARAHETLGGRWTLLIVREVLCGVSRFNDIRRGIPRISRTMLSERLQALVQAGALRRSEGAAGPEYALTEAGLELAELVKAMGVWGQRWLPRHAEREDLDLEPVLLDMQRRVRFEALPGEPLVIRFEIAGRPVRYLLLKPSEASFCGQNPGFPELLTLRAPLAAVVAWWRGDVGFAESRRLGLSLAGPRELVRAFPDWFERYLFAGVAPARRDERASA
jgi:DNA-binding HxlR family transcriptional regulator